MRWIAAVMLGCAGDDETGDPPADPTGDTGDPTDDTGDPPEPAPPCPDGGGPNLETTTGCVRGSIAASGREQFLGIPYAEPPVGDLRFAATVPIAPWSTPIDALDPGPTCVQFGSSTFSDLAVGDGAEDCLRLNVFRPVGAQDLPVMVFVHGGGHLNGSGSELYYVDPALAEEAVVVTLNYRLGPLGFLAHPSLSAADPDGVSGNMGFQDVATALAWVSANVEALGGDPGRRIVFGESAGSLESCAVLASPRTAGLFDAAILQSGPCGSLAVPLRDPPPFVVSGEEQGETFAAELGCPADALACFRSAPIEQLVDVGQSAVGPGAGDWNWQPWIDGVWLPLPVAEAFASGAFNQVPVLATVNRDEGTLFTVGIAPDEGALAAWVDTFALLIGVDREALAAQYDPALFGGSTDAAAAALYGDAIFVCPTVWQQEVLATRVEARGGYWVEEGRDLLGLGAFHASEVPYVFGTLDLPDPEDEALSARLQAAWRSMADPEPALSDLGPWPTVDGGWVELDVDPSRVIPAPGAAQCALFEDSRANPYRP